MKTISSKKKLTTFMAIMFIFAFVMSTVAPASQAVGSDNYLVIDATTNEVLSMRSLCSEAYLNDDGTITQTDHCEPIFYKTNSGALARINTSVMQPFNDSAAYKYYNEANAHSVYFRDATTQNTLMTMSIDDNEIGIRINATSTATIDANYENATVGNALISTSTVLYRGIAESTDAAYTLMNMGIRNNIILEDEDAPLTHSFEYSFGGLNITSNGNTATISDGKTAIADLTTPVIVDADGLTCGSVAMNVLTGANVRDSAIVTYTADVTEDNPTYPLTIMNMLRNGTQKEQYDLYVPSGNTVYEDSPYLMTGACGGRLYTYAETYLQFGIQTVLPPQGYAINGANISVYCLGKSNALGTGLGSYTNGVANYSTVMRGTTSAWTIAGITFGTPTTTSPDICGTLVRYLYNTSTNTLSEYNDNVPSGNIAVGKYTYGMQDLGTVTGYKLFGTDLPSGIGGTTLRYFTVWASMDSSYTGLKPIRTYTYVQKNFVSIRRITDETYREEYAETYQDKINNYLSDIDSPFNSRWHIYFTDHSNIQNTTLPAADCPSNDNHVSCCNASPQCCGPICTNDASTPNHCKNHYRNWYLLYADGKGTADITIGFFGFVPCSAGGLGGDWLATVCQPNLSYWTDNYNRRTMQHEISHLFGCHDGQCSVGEACIMNGGFDNIASFDQESIWCSNCTAAFNRNQH